MWRFGVVLLLLTAVAGAKTPHAPLPPALLQAKTIYISNRSGIAGTSDRCFDELSKWGRFQIKDSPKDADIVFQIETHATTTGYSGTTNGTRTDLTEDSARFTTISVVDHEGNILWSDTRAWGYFHSATRDVVKELRKRIEDQEKH